MNKDDIEDTTVYQVVVNQEEQYSIWPAERQVPFGWRNAGKNGPKAECLRYIKSVWTDMRPSSLIKKMQEDTIIVQSAPPPPRLKQPSTAHAGPTLNDLVNRLSFGDHAVEATRLGLEKSPQALKQCLDRGYVTVKFVDTQGGTDLGFPLDLARTDVSQADFQTNTGNVHLEGCLILNYVRVRCVADVDLGTLQGRGHLRPLDI